MFSSISVVPFDSEPYSTGPIYTPYISDSPSIARENEPSTHSREATCPGSGVNRGARGGHTGGPVGPLETLVKVGRRRVFGEPAVQLRLNYEVKVSGTRVKVQGLNYVATMLFLPTRMSSRVLTAARRTDVISRHLTSKSMLSEIPEVAIMSCLYPRVFLNVGFSSRLSDSRKPLHCDDLSSTGHRNSTPSMNRCLTFWHRESRYAPHHIGSSDLNMTSIILTAMGQSRALRCYCRHWCWQSFLRRR